MTYLYQKLESLITAYGLTKNIITGFKRSSIIPSGSRTINIAADGSPYVINAYIDNNIIYYQTNATKVKASANSLYHLFESYINLTDISGLQDVDTSNVISLANTFAGCNNLVDLSPIKNWNISNVTTLSHTFDSCYNITNVDVLANWNTSNVTNIERIFTQCSSLTDISGLKNWNTSKVTNMEGMFYYCSSLEDISGLLNWNVSNVTTLSNSFYCTKIYDLSALYKWRPDVVTNIGSMFYGCSSLNRATVCLDNWGLFNKDGYVKNSKNSSVYTTNIFANTKMASLNKFIPIWMYNDPYDKITLPTDGINGLINRWYSTYASGETYNNDVVAIKYSQSVLTDTLQIPSEHSKVSYTYDKNTKTLYMHSENNITIKIGILSNACYNCASLTDISLFRDIDTRECTDFSYAFYGCSSLTNIYPISEWSTELSTNFSYMFFGCTALTDIYPLKFWKTPQNQFSMQYMFKECTSLVDLSPLSEWNMENLTNAKEMFNQCPLTNTSLESISKWRFNKLTDFSDMFMNIFTITDARALDRWNIAADITLSDIKVLKEDGSYGNTLGSSPFCNNSGISSYKGYPWWDITKSQLRKITMTWSNVRNALYTALGNTITGIVSSDTDPQIAGYSYTQLGTDVKLYVDPTTPTVASIYSPGRVCNFTSYWLGSLLLSRNSADPTQFDNLVDISFLSNVTSTSADIEYLFADCPLVSDISALKYWNLSHTTSLSWVFAYTSITDLTPIKDWDTHNVIDMSAAFHGMSSTLGSYDISPIKNWDVSKVMNISYCFSKKPHNILAYNINDWFVNDNGTIKNKYGQSVSATSVFSDGGDLATYPKWHPNYNPATEKELLDGKSFNEAIKTLAAGSTKSWSSSDTTIKCIRIIPNSSMTPPLGATVIHLCVDQNYGKAWLDTDPIYGLTLNIDSESVKFKANTDSRYMFAMFQKLENIIGFERVFEGVQLSDITRMFAYDFKLKDFSILKYMDVSNMTHIPNVFLNCRNFESKDMEYVGNWDLSSLTYTQNTFQGCQTLTSLISLKDLIPVNYSSLSGVFSDCTSLKYIPKELFGFTYDGTNVKNASNQNVNGVNYWLSSCNISTYEKPRWDPTFTGLIPYKKVLNLQTIEIDAWRFTYALDYIGMDAVDNYSRSFVTRVEMTDIAPTDIFSTTIYHISSDNIHNNYLYMYLYCENGECVARVYYGNTNYDDVRFTLSDGYAHDLFAARYQSGGFPIDPSIHNLAKKYTNLSVLNNFVPNQSLSDMSYFFYGCESLKDISPLSICKFKVNDGYFDMMLCECASIKDINPLADCTFTNINRIGGIFDGCIALEDISVISNWSFKTNTFIYVNGLFENCSSLKDISVLGIGNWKYLKTNNMGTTFKNCSSLEDISPIANWNFPTGSEGAAMSFVFDGTNIKDFTSLNTWPFHLSEDGKVVNEGGGEIGGVLASIKSCNPPANKYPIWAQYVPTNNSVQLVSIDVLETAFRHVTQSDLSLIKAIRYASEDSTSCINIKDPSDISVHVIHMWYDNGIIYIYADARIKAPKTLSGLFRNFRNLEDIQGLTAWDTSEVISMAYMFANTKISNVSPLSKWRTDANDNLTGMFQYCSNITDLSPLKRETYTESSVTYTAWNLESRFDEHGNRYVHNKAKEGQPQIAVSNIFLRTNVTDETKYPNWWFG